MEQTTRGLIVRAGVDLAKRLIQVHPVDASGRIAVPRLLARDKARFVGSVRRRHFGMKTT